MYRVSRLAFVTAATSLTGGQPNFARCWPSHGLVHYLYIFGSSCPLTEFCQVQNSLCFSSLALSYIGSVTARHSSSRRQPKFAACYKEMELWNFCRGRHLYSAGQPSRWVSAHILVAFERNSQWKFFSKRYGVGPIAENNSNYHKL